MKHVRLIVPVIALLIFAVGWGDQTSVFAEQKKPTRQTAEEKTKACEKKNIECVNGCRNGTHLPIGSPSDSIRTCDQNCGNAFNRCNAVAKAGGQTTETFSGKNAPIMRRGIEGEQPTDAPAGSASPSDQPSTRKP